MTDSVLYRLVLTYQYKDSLKRVKRGKPDLLLPIETGVAKILRNPELGKPLRNALRNRRRISIEGSFVLLYEIKGSEVRLLDFDHHNKIYKKYSVQ